jgi:8-oxo-dGTP pyrophosphatase MutT (NUDIX family)
MSAFTATTATTAAPAAANWVIDPIKVANCAGSQPAAPAPAAPAPVLHNLSPEEIAAHVRELYPEAKHLTTVVVKPELTRIQLEKVLTCVKFSQYISTTFNHEIREMRKIEVREVFFFGPNPGFISINVDAFNRETQKNEASGYVFIRGGAVAVLVRVRVAGNLYALLTRQWRTAGGDYMTEALAGMMDNKQNPVGVALNELKEESGIALTAEQLIPLEKMFPSIGGCDEVIDFFMTTIIDMDEARFVQILAQTHGVASEGESIRIVAYPINTKDELFALMRHGDSKINSCILGLLKHEHEEAAKATTAAASTITQV